METKDTTMEVAASTQAVGQGPIVKGEKSDRVLAVQKSLEKLSYLQPGSKKADGSFDGICGPELLNTSYNYALERNFNYHDDAWTSISEPMIKQILSSQPYLTRGVDMAHYQPVVDWAVMKSRGTSFGIIKATDIGHETGNSFTDSSFKMHWQNAVAAGVPHGAYMFWHPALDPIKQADHFIMQTGTLYHAGDIVPVIDVERNDKLSAKEVNKRLQQVIDRLKAHFDKPPMIYTSKRVCDEQGITVGAECPVWLAYYVPARDVDPGPKKDMQPTFRVGPPLPKQWKDYNIWQSGYGPDLPGVPSEIDRNLLKNNLSTILL
jgi:GH25 family lysozyme M1 (1,4-beta-N-acetylmuramidase)